ncbi:hypothetical protein [Bosea sp. (in: a-proteobacteria)]|uniref:hypothetical protein n=1 Tax=Bosea sp. (in: a-proteobacteria) TaxID=1871050 RepID=UPI003F710811
MPTHEAGRSISYSRALSCIRDIDLRESVADPLDPVAIGWCEHATMANYFKKAISTAT